MNNATYSGLFYSLDQQCQLHFGVNSTYCNDESTKVFLNVENIFYQIFNQHFNSRVKYAINYGVVYQKITKKWNAIQQMQ
jgi:hypothetical protein